MPRITFLIDRDHNGKALTGYGGIPLGTDVSRDFRHDLANALEAEHGNCDNTSCDISAMMEQGYVYAATHSLQSATDELHELYRVLDAHRFNGTTPDDFGTHLYDNADWNDWKAYHDENSRECRSCGAFNYDTRQGWQCGNCLAILPFRTGDDVAFFQGALDPESDYADEEIEAEVISVNFDDANIGDDYWLRVKVESTDGEIEIRRSYLSDVSED